jgi:hypothetical protein
MATLEATADGGRLARGLLDDFARATGLEGAGPPRRYLWTDAFAVCTWLGLHRESGESRHLELALRLVDQVHHVLGRHRPDDARRGWISGLGEEEGERHPTRGGLRIGKQLPERPPGEPYDPRSEWDRDGQYFHYLTQWMHALARVAEETGNATFRQWGIELAGAAHAGFVQVEERGPRGMVWKASIDLARPLVPSMGQHDPLDGWLAYRELAGAGTELARERREALALCREGRFATDDPLGAGALLLAIHRLASRPARRGEEGEEREMLERLVAAGRASLAAVAAGDSLRLPARHRLAFRELGLAIGLHTLERLAGEAAEAAGELVRHVPLARTIDRFWSEPAHRQAASWTDHADINSVMLATSLKPAGYLGSRD